VRHLTGPVLIHCIPTLRAAIARSMT
jgi:hypothetical protein